MREAQWDAANNVWKCCHRTVISRCPNCPHAGKERPKRLYPDDGGLREPVRSFEETPSAFDMLREHFAPKPETPEPVIHPDDKLASREIVATLTIDRMLCLRVGERRAVQQFVTKMLDELFDRYPTNTYDKITLHIENL